MWRLWSGPDVLCRWVYSGWRRAGGSYPIIQDRYCAGGMRVNRQEREKPGETSTLVALPTEPGVMLANCFLERCECIGQQDQDIDDDRVARA